MDETEVKEILDHKALRDRFAIAALPHVLDMVQIDERVPAEHAKSVAARTAYELADAMLKERDR